VANRSINGLEPYHRDMADYAFEQQLLHARYADAERRAREAAEQEAADRQEQQSRERFAAMVLRIGGRVR
jgi:hypothetical protein